MTETLALALAALFLAVSSPAAGFGGFTCPPGQHKVRTGREESCARDSSGGASSSFGRGGGASGGCYKTRPRRGRGLVTVCPGGSSTGSSSSGSNGSSAGSSGNAPSQQAERKGWNDFGAAISKYNNAVAASQLAARNGAAAQRGLDNADCGGLPCDGSHFQDEINAANMAQSNEGTVINQAIAACQRAVSEIQSARGQEHGAGVPSIDSRRPSCPNGNDGGRRGCPSGTAMRFGKCLSLTSSKPRRSATKGPQAAGSRSSRMHTVNH
ncbi:MAG: hypothetical protein KGL53_07750 [Elusimicrobia bacterium]|nr:hypothetical protein [Elusimicrobiota bacterium]